MIVTAATTLSRSSRALFGHVLPAKTSQGFCSSGSSLVVRVFSITASAFVTPAVDLFIQKAHETVVKPHDRLYTTRDCSLPTFVNAATAPALLEKAVVLARDSDMVISSMDR